MKDTKPTAKGLFSRMRFATMNSRDVRRVDAILLLIGVAVVLGLWIAVAQPWKPVLTVWSCGSNYESLSDFCRQFGEKHDCRVRYTASPVQFLLEYTMKTDTPPDVIVGRAGPGWQALKQAGKLEKGPVFFAMDPYVIITPSGNPAKIRDLVDLGRKGVRVASSPSAMRPRGKCPAHLISVVDDEFSPGFSERWENNCASNMQCGRSLTEPVIAKEVDAAVVPRCVTSWPSVQGKLEVISIQPKYTLAMKQCKATIPQCCGLITNSRQKSLAEEFIKEMTSKTGETIFSKHGYLPINSPGGQELKGLIQVFTPQDIAGWQMHMANGLYEDGAMSTALRRFLNVINIFGPNQYDAQARYWAGKCLQSLGNMEAAHLQWNRVVNEFPRKGKHEWESEVLHVGKPVPGIKQLPESHWVTLAQKELDSKIHIDKGYDDKHKQFLSTFKLTHKPVIEGDPDKNGTRNLQLGKDLLEAGQYESASRDLLKVMTLNYPSRHMCEARFWLGAASYLRGLTGLAITDWTSLINGNDRWAVAARKALKMVDNEPREAPYTSSIPMPPWKPAFDTHAERGMTYGMYLWQHHMPVFCFKEMVKILSGEYKKPGKLAPQARYRMGVCCTVLNKPESAFSEWTLVQRCYPEAQKWVQLSHKAQEKLPLQYRKNLPFAARVVTSEEIAQFKKIPKASFAQRYKGADELFNAEIFENNQCLLEYWKVMTVTDPSQQKNKHLRPMAEYKAGICCLKNGQQLAAKKHFENVIKKYPADKAAKLAGEALRKVGV